MTFLRNAWYVAMWSQDLGEAPQPRRILDEPLVFFRTADGKLCALTDACPHRQAPLHLGKIVGDRLRCQYHGLEFDTSGACVRNPHASGRIPPNAKVRAYPVVEKHTLVWVWMGESAADPLTIPDFSLFDTADPATVSRKEWMRMKAHYYRIVENLLDLSHATVLHEGVLGNEEMIPAKVSVEQNGATLNVSRLNENVPPPQLYNLLFKRDDAPVDIWASILWHAPSNLLNDTGATSPGGKRADGTGVFGAHFLTPETETTTLYHFAAVRQNPRTWGEPIDSELRALLSELRHEAFDVQDRVMIEGQQRNMDDPAIDKERPIFLEVDAGPTRFRRIMDELLRQDREVASIPASAAE
ncbi:MULTISPECIES: aromatic ring-hydroxylating dioxygenase subunit alpha [unclassified Beijerinckia]|uniref:aromatic ring-hydroxylating dioxygenase subunit alpha n=1 Tax=unclassified Beijerinckia TaxID=2638183 RepID=UPI000897327E|nr:MULTISPECIES: aromatic ring-hydroxylating dioxygenase subunit alpha [unclassified Beijerinckia]MDH7799809.1 phenylpropionate dioxygenase-like ring-hydroxylating dioxygenase large terminal subunit [Beijerinckia sp. GAS462]SED38262.1 vanillate O-demethylase monooxygenase subunit [Beijerinckia sp. 28-YEA-48]